MAFFLQYRAIQRHVKEELQRVSDSPDAFSAITPEAPKEYEKWGGIPGITLVTDNNKESYYQVGFTGPDDPFNPKTWSTLHRIGATLLVCSVAFVATLASAIDAAVLTNTTEEFGVSDVAGSLATALFLVGFGLGALLLSPLSELVGRFPVYIGSLSIFGCWILGAALAPNFGAHLVFRFLAGFSASTPLTVAGGTVGDLWSPVEKTFAFPLFAVPAFSGPIFGTSLQHLYLVLLDTSLANLYAGPIIGAYIGYVDSVSWRWAEWVVLILDGAVILMLFLFKAESFAPRILYYKARQLRKLTGNPKFMTAHEAEHTTLGALLSKCFFRPFVLCLEPIVLAFTLYLVIVYVILFTFLDGYPYIFAQTYGINEGLSNICFLGLFVGILLVVALVPFVYRSTIKQLERDGDDGSGKAIFRESRLYFAMVGAPALPIGLFWMGWTDYVSIRQKSSSSTFLTCTRSPSRFGHLWEDRSWSDSAISVSSCPHTCT
jgi:MFS family permease